MRPAARSGMRRLLSLAAAMWSAAAWAGACGDIMSIETHDQSRTRYTFVAAPDKLPAGPPVALVLLAGGSGYLNLGDDGCPRALKGNSLVRMQPLFHEAGFATALVDAPSDYVSDDGLAGFRIASKHADDLGRVIADVRRRTKGAVWLVGTSRGTISAVNAASRLSGDAAPDGLVLTSALMLGDPGARKYWVAHSVFDLPLKAINMPVLIVGHAADSCTRSPATMMERLAGEIPAARKQVVTVTGGAFPVGGMATLNSCEGRAPHGYVDQEDEVAKGIARFAGGGRY